MILLSMWFLNLALAAAIVIAILQKRRRNREKATQEAKPSKSEEWQR